MRKPQNILIIACILLFNCSAIDELTKFDLDYQSNYTIESTTILNTPFSLFTPDITTNSESSFENNNTHKDLIESIRIKTVRITIDSPEDGNFNFLKDIRVFISADSVEEVEIANLIDLENMDVNTLELQIENQELKEFIKEDSFNLRIETVTDETLSQSIEITIDTTFRVDAEVLGI